MTPCQAVKNPITCEDRRRRFVGPWSTFLADAASVEHKSKENSVKRTRVVAICSGFILFAAGFWAREIRAANGARSEPNKGYDSAVVGPLRRISARGARF
jgi:hypothetical protein